MGKNPSIYKKIKRISVFRCYPPCDTLHQDREQRRGTTRTNAPLPHGAVRRVRGLVGGLGLRPHMNLTAGMTNPPARLPGPRCAASTRRNLVASSPNWWAGDGDRSAQGAARRIAIARRDQQRTECHSVHEGAALSEEGYRACRTTLEPRLLGGKKAKQALWQPFLPIRRISSQDERQQARVGRLTTSAPIVLTFPAA